MAKKTDNGAGKQASPAAKALKALTLDEIPAGFSDKS